MGGAQAIAALAYGTETVERVDVVVGPGQPVRAGGQAPALGDRGDRRLRRPERPARSCSAPRRASASCGWRRSTCSPRPSTARAASWSRCPPAARVVDALMAMLEDLALERPTVGDAAFALVDVAETRRGRRARERVRARAPAADRRRGRGARAAGAQRRLPVRGRRRARRPSATTSRAATTCCPTGGAARFASTLSAAPLPPPDGRGADRRRGGQARGGGRADRPRGGIRGARRVDGGPHRGRIPSP